MFITDGAHSLESADRDFRTLCAEEGIPENRLIYYPAVEPAPNREGSPDALMLSYRLCALLTIGATGSGPLLIATSIQALLQPTAAPDRLQADTLSICVDEEWAFEDLPAALTDRGYVFGPEVFEPGQAAVKGGLLDVWPLTDDWPSRIEFDGPRVESIRRFHPANQCSVERCDTVLVAPAKESDTDRADRDETASLVEYLPDDAILLWSDPESIEAHARSYGQLLADVRRPRAALSFEALQARLRRRASFREAFLEGNGPPGTHVVDLGLVPVEAVSNVTRDVLQPDIVEQARHELLEDLRQRAERGDTVVMYFDRPGSLAHFRERPERIEEAGALYRVGYLSAGFTSEKLRLTVVCENDLYGRRRRSNLAYDPGEGRRRAPHEIGTQIGDLTAIEPGDLVVHPEYGVGRYLGLNEIRFAGQLQEVLTIEYADEAKLHVPAIHAHLLSRYVGLSRHRVKLHKLGGKRWKRERQTAEQGIVDLASSLLELQARRQLLHGFTFSDDKPWQIEFEGAFPYHETRDQQTSIHLVKRDMQSAKPMDRLVCGEAGYGKTEVAMRAAFKAVLDDRQVAVLVPTTVLAQQHFDTFRERMAPYPVRIEMLSRFRTRKQQDRILCGMQEGTVDIVIGTHALLQPRVRFKDLGLVIIDEEQRFGVDHKERLKQLRHRVDVLTLTATPIPRTLYMSLTGAREISLIQTPPGERMAIETIVARNDDETIRKAIRRETNREGQVFYLHNRVMSIERVRRRLARIVPEARVEIAHGQMPTSELASVMRRFIAGQFDVLLCTTIIESGVDIPRANTILIDRADRFGLADLYQLRGRVGRSHRKAYAYLLLPSHGHLDADARKRITAMRRYSSRKAGFQLALRDLEIRGAGNLLGAEQSGHIAAVGFGLYCQLLGRTVARLKGKALPPVIDAEVKLDFIRLAPHETADSSSAFIPYGFIEEEGLRIGIYRRIAEATATDDIERLEVELRDRFGPLPPPVTRLLQVARIRILASQRGLRRVEAQDDKLMLSTGTDYVKDGTRFPRIQGDDADRKLDHIIRLVSRQQAVPAQDPLAPRRPTADPRPRSRAPGASRSRPG